jgi:uncharacterized protein with von Willebrand factor type A (vWA) domain
MGADLAVVGAAFGGRLRAAGLDVSVERIGRFVRGIAVVRPLTVGELRSIGRVTLVSGPDDRDRFDAVFAEIFGGLDDVAEHRGDPSAPAVRRNDRPPPWSRRPEPPADASGDGGAPEPRFGPEGDGTGDDGDEQQARLAVAASREERLATTDFAELTDDELRELYETMRSLRLAIPPRHGRRHRRHRHGDRLDLRATVRRSRRTGGEPFDHVTRRRRPRPRRLVVLCDISGSMAPYSRAFVQFLHAAVGASGGSDAEVFTFATRLTRVTRALAVRQPDVALARAAAAAADWRGGTRVGDCLKTFLDDHGRRGLARRAVVVVVSDGWDRSEPGVLGEQMARLRRLAHRVVWINPRRAAPGFQPLAAGMAAALPHCDAFVSGHTLAALRDAMSTLTTT